MKKFCKTLLAGLVLSGGVSSCHDDTSGGDAGALIDVVPADGRFEAEPEECGGVVQSTGSTPAGPFSATKVHVVRNDDFSRLEVGLFDVASGTSLTFAMPIDHPPSGGIETGTRNVERSVRTRAEVTLRQTPITS